MDINAVKFEGVLAKRGVFNRAFRERTFRLLGTRQVGVEDAAEDTACHSSSPTQPHSLTLACLHASSSWCILKRDAEGVR